MGRCSEPEKPQDMILPNSREAQVPVSNGTRAKEGSGFSIRKSLRDGITEFFRYESVLGIASMGMATGPTEAGTEILIPIPAKLTRSARGVNPRDSHAITGIKSVGPRSEALHSSNDFVSRDDRKVWLKSSLDLIEFGMADPARGDLDQYLPGSRDRVGQVDQGEGALFNGRGLPQHHSFHGLHLLSIYDSTL